MSEDNQDVPTWLRVGSRAGDIYVRFPLDQIRTAAPDPQVYGAWTIRRIYRLRVLPLRLRYAVWKIAHQTGLDQTWFEPFRRYWSVVLGGRPLWNVQEFHFARCF